jgi:3-oxoadipate enol-lactonase
MPEFTETQFGFKRPWNPQKKGAGKMHIEANGIRMNYELTGKAGAPVVALSHSLSSSLAMWDPQMEALEPDFQVLRYDTRGHGGTDAPQGPYALEQLAADALALLDTLNIDVVHWVGLSMGGMIAQCLALEHADRLLSLALCDTAPVTPDEAQPIWDERIRMAREKGMEALVDDTMGRWFTAPFLKENPPEVQRIRKQMSATPLNGYIGCSEAIRRLNYLDRLSEIRLPTLIIVGEEDPGTPVAASEAMHQRISDSRLVVLPSAAHMSNVEQAEAFNEHLLGFLRGA